MMPPEMATKYWSPPPAMIETEIANMNSAFGDRIGLLAPNAAFFQFAQTFLLGPRNLAMMLIGMALFKTGFFTLRWPVMQYVVSGAIMLAIGLFCSNFAARDALLHDFAFEKMLPGQSVLFWGSLAHAYGYAALIMALCKVPFLSLLRMPFAAAGRMALTNYLACSLFGWFAYLGPPGPARVGDVSYAEQAWTSARRCGGYFDYLANFDELSAIWPF